MHQPLVGHLHVVAKGSCVFSLYVVWRGLPNNSLANSYSKLFKQKPWAKGSRASRLAFPATPLLWLIQQLFQGPPPGPGPVRSLMESAGSELTHGKKKKGLTNHFSCWCLPQDDQCFPIPSGAFSPLRIPFLGSPEKVHCRGWGGLSALK